MFSSPRVVQTLDARFWLYHFWLPLLFVVPTLYLFEHTSIDSTLADYWYQLEGGYWSLRNNWFTLLPGLVVGFAFGFAQELSGAHFISQDLWSVSISWFGALLLLKLAWRFKSAGEKPESRDSQL